ncbi:WD40 repeat [Dillenia turbinata]|uniref:WD40 repeat n=1 Tax=Dillenia turbinata TaxID=194707 RepID=A0AAN8VT64_9MAGN
MGNCSDGEYEQFFDTRDEITSVSDLSDCSEDYASCSGQVDSSVSRSFQFEFWTKNPDSVHERRTKFLEWMGIGVNRIAEVQFGDQDCERRELDIGRITEESGAVLRNSDFGERLSASQSSRSCCSNEASEEIDSEESFVYRFKNLDDGTEFVVDELGQDGMLQRLRHVGSNRLVTVDEFQRNLGSSPLVERFLRREVELANNVIDTKKKVKKGWLKRFVTKSHLVHRQKEAVQKPYDVNPVADSKIHKVRAQSYRKQMKELSSIYNRQEFHAHDGSILCMKFSPDGHFLASGGEDGIVCIWEVIEEDMSNKFDIPDIDPSCLYFTVNHHSKLSPFDVNKDGVDKKKRLTKSSESTCVIFPPKLFHIREKPLHKLHGHKGEVLDLSWSRKGYLLSSSVDNTVRLWQVGRNQCLEIFSHNNYVTCVDFNPVDDNFFISGSIDGKVRIWEVLGCRVIDWIDVREIVSAVCYRPDGKGGVVGSMDGSCRFYDIIDDHLQLDAQISLKGKKKSPCKQITCFQFSPCDPSLVMVTSADSQVRILHGVNVIGKFKGYRNMGSQMSTSFTSDGKHIVAAGDDSTVYVWNSIANDRSGGSQAKKIWSYESFFSNNCSIAVPWAGMKSSSGMLSPSTLSGDILVSSLQNGQDHHHHVDSDHRIPFSSPDCFTLGRGFFLEPLLKGTATWPEENLPISSSRTVSSTLSKSELKFLSSTYQSALSSPHLWGLVIVAAGWDGRIRTYHNYGLPIHR